MKGEGRGGEGDEREIARNRREGVKSRRGKERRWEEEVEG